MGIKQAKTIVPQGISTKTLNSIKLSGEIAEVENEDDSKSSVSFESDKESSDENSNKSRKGFKMPFVSV